VLILILLLNHLIADFVLQSRKIAEKKEKFFKIAIYHALVHFVVAVVLLLICYLFTYNRSLLSFQIFIAIALVSIFHFLIDTYGKKLFNKLLNNNDFFVFLVDQFLHLIIIFVIVFLLVPNYNFDNIFNSIFVINIINKTFFIIFLVSIIFILLTTFTGHMIAKLFKSLSHENRIDNSEEVKVVERTTNDRLEVITEKIKFPVEVNDYGKWIGYCERIIIFLLVIIQVYEGIAIIVALKTFARYQQLNQKNFVEKYLLGTLFSVMMGVLLGFLFRSLNFIF